MKHRHSASLALLILAAVVLTFAGGLRAAPAADGEQAYKAILDHAYQLLAKEIGPADAQEGEAGLSEIAQYAQYAANSLNRVGYAVVDITGDGVPELLLARIADRYNRTCFGNEIFAVYTSTGGRPVLSFEGWSRNTFTWVGDGTFINTWSSGIASNGTDLLKLSADGAKRLYLEQWFIEERKNDPEKADFYHSTYDSEGRPVKEREKITDSEFSKVGDDLNERYPIRYVRLKPFALYGEEDMNEGSDDEGFGGLSAQWKDDAPDAWEYEEFAADEGEYLSSILFRPMPGGEIRDFKLLKLSDMNMDGDGRMSFKTRVLHTVKRLTREKPLVVKVFLSEGMPSCGISYVGADGTTRRFIVSESGMDGSVVLSKF